MEVKKRRITKKDQDAIAKSIKDELAERQRHPKRKLMERIWQEIDRQIAMEPPKARPASGKKEDWHSAVQLGDLADASEIIAADVMRMTFPFDRNFFKPHIELSPEIDEETGEQAKPDPIQQRTADNTLRSFMLQQQKDFGFKERVKLSVKEALAHGGFVAEVRWTDMPKYHDGTAVESLSAPTWIPHSMWNCYPDHSPSIVGTDLFYRGNMIIIDYLPQHKLDDMTEWVNTDRVKKEQEKVKKSNTKDIELVYYYGDIVVRRNDGHMVIPNRKTIIANGVYVYSEINDTPYSPIIYTGYEKDDPRDPYYTSPIIKRSPMHKLATFFANKAADAIELRTEPPIVYDRLDSAFSKNGGVPLAPRAQIGGQGTAGFKIVEVADPSWALNGFQMAKQHVAEGTGTDAVRKGVSPGTEQTATEVIKTDQKSEIRTVDFVGVLERQAITPFLYMQHDLNIKKLKSYPFYCDDPRTPDFLRINKSDLPKAVHFEMTGSRSLLGEEQRTQRFRETAAFVLSNEGLSAKSNTDEIMRQIWADTGQKDPERFVINQEGNPEVEQIKQEAEAAIEELQGQLQQAAQELERFNLIDEKNNAEKASLKADINSLQEQLRIVTETMQSERRLTTRENQIERQEQRLNELQRPSS